ncbi:MAG: tetratricopeptide (TPR) repeat protein [Crocinitomicaceae bacterium]|jgi:tetratricopeptide (TPR) repeat protein
MKIKSLLTLGFVTASLFSFSQVIEKEVVTTETAHNSITATETGMYDGTESEEAGEYYDMAVDYARKKDTKNAVKYYLKSIKADPGFEEAYDNLGRVYRTMGEYEKAIECYNKSIEIYPNGEMAHQNLAVVYGIQEKLDKALVQYDILQKISSENPESYFGAANIYMQQEKFDKALENANKALELYIASNSHYIGEAYYLVGLIHYYNDDLEEAKKSMQIAKDKGTKLSPELEQLIFGEETSESTEKSYILEKPEDYAQYEEDIVAMVDWLANTPTAEKPEVRKQVSTFLLQWLTGSPTVSVELSTKIVTYMDCGECMFLFMGGWAKYSIQSEDNDTFKASLAGTELAIQFYKNNKKDLGKNKDLEKLITLQDSNELEDFIRSNME